MVLYGAAEHRYNHEQVTHSEGSHGYAGTPDVQQGLVLDDWLDGDVGEEGGIGGLSPRLLGL